MHNSQKVTKPIIQFLWLFEQYLYVGGSVWTVVSGPGWDRRLTMPWKAGIVYRELRMSLCESLVSAGD